MIPFKIPNWRKRLIDQKYQKKASVINQAVSSMETVMGEAIDYILEHFYKTGRYLEPSLAKMDQVSETFYRSVVTIAFHTASDEKKGAQGKKKLSSALPLGLPRTLKGMEKIFRDKRSWPVIMKRSKILTDRLRKQYLQKLQRKFKALLPRIQANAITPLEAKKAMMNTWDASKSRVELIFRTETTTYFSKTQTAFFSGDPEIIGFLFDSVRDTSRTVWCQDRHGLVFRPGTKELRENTPACHWNCRSHLIPLANTSYNRTLLEDPRRDPSNRKIAPLPPGWRK